MDQEKKEQLKEKKNLSKIVAICLLLVVFAVLTILAFPLVMKISEPEYQQKFREWVDHFGVAGWFILLLIQIGQVVIAVIPGEPVEVAAGVMYGTLGGLLTCLLGVLLGSMLVFGMVRKLGTPVIRIFFSEEKLNHFSFLQNTQKLESVTFILFLIPGTPKDILTYVAGITPIKPSQFLTIATLARIPSIITSTWAGSSLGDGNLLATILIFVATGAIGLAGIYFNKWYTNRLHKQNPSCSPTNK